MTTAEKFSLIDEYLADGHIDPRWRDMILEYRRLLIIASKEGCHINTDKLQKRTNADNIRNMSNEELAEMMMGDGHFSCSYCVEDERLSDNPFAKYEKCDEKCVEHCLAWLNAEYKEVQK